MTEPINLESRSPEELRGQVRILYDLNVQMNESAQRRAVAMSRLIEENKGLYAKIFALENPSVTEPTQDNDAVDWKARWENEHELRIQAEERLSKISQTAAIYKDAYHELCKQNGIGRVWGLITPDDSNKENSHD